MASSWSDTTGVGRVSTNEVIAPFPESVSNCQLHQRPCGGFIPYFATTWYVCVTTVLFPARSVAVTVNVFVPRVLASTAVPGGTSPAQLATDDPASEQE